MRTKKLIKLVAILIIVGVLSLTNSIGLVNGVGGQSDANASTLGLAQSNQSWSWIYEGPIYLVDLYYISEDGTFKALTEKIPELKELGIKTIWLVPIFDHSNPKIYHHVVDYYKIYPPHGSEADLRELIETVHKNGMRIIFDLVTSYAPEDSILWKEHKDWFIYDENGTVQHTWPNDFGLAINRKHPEVIKYFSEVAKYYVEEYDIDGWRMDSVANNWNPKTVQGDYSCTELLRSVKQAITSVKPDAILLAEQPGPLYQWPSPYNPPWIKFNGSGFRLEYVADPVFDEMCELSQQLGAFFYYWIVKVSEGALPTSSDLVYTLHHEKIWYGRARVRFIEHYDTVGRFGRIQVLAPNLHKPLATLIFTIPGVPLITAGQEVGATGGWQETVDWEHGDYTLRCFYKKLMQIRSMNKALLHPSANITDVWAGGDITLAYLRNYEDNYIITVINLRGKPASSILSLPVQSMDIKMKDKYTLYDLLSGEIFPVNGSELTSFQVKLEPYGTRILLLYPGTDVTELDEWYSKIALEEAETALKQAKRNGIIVGLEIKELLQQARESYNSGEYRQAIQLAKQIMRALRNTENATGGIIGLIILTVSITLYLLLKRFKVHKRIMPATLDRLLSSHPNSKCWRYLSFPSDTV